MKSIRSLMVLLATLCFTVGAGPALADHLSSDDVTVKPDITFTLRTDISEGKLVFKGEKGDIAGIDNPDLVVPEDAVVQINLVNGDGATHDIAIPEFNASSDEVHKKGSATAIVFRASKEGTFEYLCTLPGHKAAGMFGNIIVGEAGADVVSDALEVAKDPNEVGEPVGDRAPEKVTFDLETTEVQGRLDDGSTYTYWTFDDTVPGPMLRARVGDEVTINLTNREDSRHIHSVDFHAVTGPGGGAAVTQVAPGQTKSFSFTALQPGLYVYHCATPMVAQHITNGMYGMILIEPEGGMSKVDKEFYVMQGELYTNEAHGARGHQEFSLEKLLAENPEHMMFNGSMDSLTKTHKMEAEVGDNVRIYFGVGGPNLVSSFHVIGEIFDKVYESGSVTTPALTDIQTTLVAPGSSTIVEFQVDYPGDYILVDHALSRMEKGLAGILTVTGEKDDSIFKVLK